MYGSLVARVLASTALAWPLVLSPTLSVSVSAHGCAYASTGPGGRTDASAVAGGPRCTPSPTPSPPPTPTPTPTPSPTSTPAPSPSPSATPGPSPTSPRPPVPTGGGVPVRVAA
ncbi:hypothetical protein ACE14D_15215, partial [Streptomyces sp. Act-28]